MLPWRYVDKPIECGPEFVDGISESEWQCSGKYDGWRLVILTDEHRIPHLFSRVGTSIAETNAYVPQELIDELVAVCAGMPPLSALDSEFVGPRGNHKPHIFIFDQLAEDGLWLVKRQFQVRWEMASRLEGLGGHISLAETVTTGFRAYFDRLKKIWYDGGCSKMDLHEGIVLKRRTGKLTLSLTSNAKSPHMYKLKYRDILERRY